jgi:hypothetical protein
MVNTLYIGMPSGSFAKRDKCMNTFILCIHFMYRYSPLIIVKPFISAVVGVIQFKKQSGVIIWNKIPALYSTKTIK